MNKNLEKLIECRNEAHTILDIAYNWVGSESSALDVVGLSSFSLYEEDSVALTGVSELLYRNSIRALEALSSSQSIVNSEPVLVSVDVLPLSSDLVRAVMKHGRSWINEEPEEYPDVASIIGLRNSRVCTQKHADRYTVSASPCVINSIEDFILLKNCLQDKRRLQNMTAPSVVHHPTQSLCFDVTDSLIAYKEYLECSDLAGDTPAQGIPLESVSPYQSPHEGVQDLLDLVWNGMVLNVTVT